MTYFEYHIDVMRDIALGKRIFIKCPCCDNNGVIYYNGITGDGASPFSRSELGEDETTCECNNCDGLGYILK